MSEHYVSFPIGYGPRLGRHRLLPLRLIENGHQTGPGEQVSTGTHPAIKARKGENMILEGAMHLAMCS